MNARPQSAPPRQTHTHNRPLRIALKQKDVNGTNRPLPSENPWSNLGQEVDFPADQETKFNKNKDQSRNVYENKGNGEKMPPQSSDILGSNDMNRRTFYAEMTAIDVKYTPFFSNPTPLQPPSLLPPKSHNS